MPKQKNATVEYTITGEFPCDQMDDFKEVINTLRGFGSATAKVKVPAWEGELEP